MSCLGFHRYEATVHETHHVADRVHCGEFLLNLSLIVIEHLHRMWQVQVVVDGILVVVVFLREVFVDGLSLGDVLNEVLDLHMALILPGIDRAPMLVEGLLHLFHLFVGSLLGIFLHAGVDGGVDFQTLGIKGVTVIKVFLAPAFQIIGHSLAEVVGIAIVGTFYAVVKFDVEPLQ